MAHEISNTESRIALPTTETESPVERITKPLPEEEKKIKWKTLMKEAALFVCFSSLLIASFTSETLRESTIWELEGWRWSLLLYALLAGWILARWAVRLLGVSVELLRDGASQEKKIKVDQRGEKEEWITASLILSLRQSGTGFIWVVLVLVGWLLLIIFRIGESKDRPDKETRRGFSFVTRAIVGVLVGFVMWMAKTLLLEYLALHYIIKKSERKPREIEKEQEQLSAICQEIDRETAQENPIGIRKETGAKNKRIKRALKDEHEAITKSCNWTTKLLVDRITRRDLPIYVEKKDIEDDGWEDISFERVAKLTGDNLFDEIAEICKRQSQPTRPAGGSGSQPTNRRSRPRFIKKIDGPRILDLVKGVIEPVKPLMTDTGERYRRSDFRKWLVKVYRHRLDLLRTLNGRDDALRGLNSIVSTFQLVLILVVWLIITGLLTGHMLILILTEIVAFSFMFGESVKTGFESILYVYVTQPFDVGNLIKVEGDDREMVVHHMNVLSTFFRFEDGRKVLYPNSSLIKKDITKLYHAPDTSDTVEFNIAADTPESKIDQLVKHVEEYLNQDSKKWNERFSFMVEEETDSDGRPTKSVTLKVYHKVYHRKGGYRARRRNELTAQVREYIKDRNIRVADED